MCEADVVCGRWDAEAKESDVREGGGSLVLIIQGFQDASQLEHQAKMCRRCLCMCYRLLDDFDLQRGT